MSNAVRKIVSFAPYKVLPASTGGHWGIVSLHNGLGKVCEDHLICTQNNAVGAHNYSFILHPVLDNSAKRYLPFYNYAAIYKLVKALEPQALFCDHPYMALMVNRIAKSLQVPWFLRSHNIESLRFKTLKRKWWKGLFYYEQYAMRKADGIFFITPEEKDWAITNYKLAADKSYLVPYGTDLETRPVVAPHLKEKVAAELQLDARKKWLYFLGVLDYLPNRDAVEHILNEIAPRLKEQCPDTEIIIAGKNLDKDLQEQIKQTGSMHYVGFVKGLPDFINACDMMLNPLLTGGGIKTKAVEALAYNKIVISTQNAAYGLIPEYCGANLHICPDGDWDAFVAQIIANYNAHPQIPDAFYEHYNWEKLGRIMLAIMLSG